MRLWRIARAAYEPLDGEGARRVGGRWNEPGLPVVYASEHLSLAALELLVHVDPDLVPDDLHAFEVDVPDGASVESVGPAELPDDWRLVPDHPRCREIGAAWIGAGAALLLRVPSVIVPEERNVLLNPAHPAAKDIRIAGSRPFGFDPRLLERR